MGKYDIKDSIKRIGEVIREIPDSNDKIGTSKESKEDPTGMMDLACLVCKISMDQSIVDFVKYKIVQVLSTEIPKIMEDSDAFFKFESVGSSFICYYNTPFKRQIDNIIDIAAKINSFIDIVKSVFLEDRNSAALTLLMYLDYGNMFVTKGSNFKADNKDSWIISPIITKSINELNKVNSGTTLIVTPVIYKNLKEEYQKFFKSSQDQLHYTTTIYNAGIEEILRNKKNSGNQ